MIMHEQQRLEIVMACLRLTNDFCLLSDRRDYEAYALLYAHNGRFTRPGLDVSGREAIVAALKQRPAHLIVRHGTVNAIVDVIDEDHAHGRGNHLVFIHDSNSGQTQPIAVTDYVDHYVRSSEGWKIASREVSRAL
jgi:SnoaL-like domain